MDISKLLYKGYYLLKFWFKMNWVEYIITTMFMIVVLILINPTFENISYWVRIFVTAVMWLFVFVIVNLIKDNKDTNVKVGYWQQKTINNKMYKLYFEGIWDGEKAVFEKQNNEIRIIVRNKKYLIFL